MRSWFAIWDPTSIYRPDQRRQRTPNTRVLRSEKNLGLPGATTGGCGRQKGDFVFIVNNDTKSPPSCWMYGRALLPGSHHRRYLPQDPVLSAADMIQYAGFNPSMYYGRTTAVGSKEIDKGQCDGSGYTHGAMDALCW